MTKTVSELGLTPLAGDDIPVSGLSVDSRKVQRDHLFAAIAGANTHGATHIRMALEMGATAILTDREGAKLAADALEEYGPTLIVVEDPRQALAYSAALFYGQQPDVMAAVTGTNGKTSVANFTRQIWQLLGQRAVNIGTTGVEGDWHAPSPNTTPEPITLHALLSEAATFGISHGAMEASSHGLSQKRMDGVRLTAAAFTNLSQDHLDYHASFDAYFAAKAGLFTRLLPEDGVAVINIDDTRGSELEGVCAERGVNVMRVGRSEAADIRVVNQRFDAGSQEIRVDFLGNIYQLQLDLIGGFQAENVMAAAGLVMACGADPEEVFSCLPELKGVRGRMEHAGTRENGAQVFVDYAHTPDAISTALKALRPHVMGRIIAIIGAGGDRDTTKRPLMGQAAQENADLVIVTDDNPRSEDPATIRAEVLSAVRDGREIGDRGEAIRTAISELRKGDTLLIAGKGHETGQIIGDKVIPFSDQDTAMAALKGGVHV